MPGGLAFLLIVAVPLAVVFAVAAMLGRRDSNRRKTQREAWDVGGGVAGRSAWDLPSGGGHHGSGHHGGGDHGGGGGHGGGHGGDYGGDYGGDCGGDYGGGDGGGW